MSKRDIDFSRSLQQVKKRIHPDSKLRKSTLTLLDKMMKQLNRKLLDACKKSSNGKVKLDTVSKAVDEILVGVTRAHAQREGNRVLLQYHSGLTAFQPERIKLLKDKDRAVAKKKLRGSEFSKGVVDLCGLICPDVTLQPKGKLLLCKYLEELSQKIARNARGAVPADELTIADVYEALEDILPEVMLNHAVAEGNKMVVLKESGRCTFAPVKQKVPKKAAATRGRSVSSSSKMKETKSERRARSSSLPSAPPQKRQCRTSRPSAVAKPKKTLPQLLEPGVMKLDKCFDHTLAKEAKELAAQNQARLLEKFVDELGGAAHIGPEEIDNAIRATFPEELVDLAQAHLSQILSSLAI